jgi:DNA-binding CsgD family transcriptional regulator
MSTSFLADRATTSARAVHSRPLPPVVGRAAELSRIDELVRGARARTPGGSLVVSGPPGIGKSCLIRSARQMAASSGVRVIDAVGVDAERGFALASLHRLLRPLLREAPHAAAPQAAALRTAFGMDGAAPPSAFGVASAALELLAAVAEERPLLIVADDAQWLDRASADVIAFIARRSGGTPIRVLAALRDGPTSTCPFGDLPRLHLVPLDQTAARELAAASCGDGGDAARVLPRVLGLAAGNPLALVELPALLREEGSRHVGLPGLIPLPPRLEEAFARPLGERPQAQRLLLLAAADGMASVGDLLAAARRIDGSDGHHALAELTSTRVLVADGLPLRFAHPLTRSAVYQQASPAERHAAHAALAAVLADRPDRRVWHEAIAVSEPDDGIAAALREAAERAERNGELPRAVHLHQLAAARGRTPDGARQALLEAAEVAFELGRPAVSSALLRQADHRVPVEGNHPRRRLVRSLLTIPRGDRAAIRDGIDAAARSASSGDVDLAAKLLLHAARVVAWSDSSPEMGSATADAAGSLGLRDDDPRLLAIGALAAPTRRGRAVIDAVARSRPALAATEAALLGEAACALGDPSSAVGLLTTAADDARMQQRHAVRARALALRAQASLHLGHLDQARADATRASGLTQASGQAGWALTARAVSAQVAGLRGDGESERLAADVERKALGAGLAGMVAAAQLARGLAALSNGCHDVAFEVYARLLPLDARRPTLQQALLIGDLAEAAARVDRVRELEPLLGRVEALCAHVPSPRLRVALAHGRPLVAVDERAEALYRAGLSACPAGWPVATARLELAYGTWLRRQRRPTESRAPLRAALATFEALGMTPWAVRARNELRAAGAVAPSVDVPAPVEDLTPQELEIARLAASGLSNRAIGQQLFLSHRTVGAHLYRIFPKLGVTSRGQLAGVLMRVAA